jgi:hypothetical protein
VNTYSTGFHRSPRRVLDGAALPAEGLCPAQVDDPHPGLRGHRHKVLHLLAVHQDPGVNLITLFFFVTVSPDKQTASVLVRADPNGAPYDSDGLAAVLSIHGIISGEEKKGLIPMGLGLQGPVRAMPVVQVLRGLGQPKVYLQHVSSSHKVRIFFCELEQSNGYLQNFI